MVIKLFGTDTFQRLHYEILSLKMETRMDVTIKVNPQDYEQFVKDYITQLLTGSYTVTKKKWFGLKKYKKVVKTVPNPETVAELCEEVFKTGLIPGVDGFKNRIRTVDGFPGRVFITA